MAFHCARPGALARSCGVTWGVSCRQLVVLPFCLHEVMCLFISKRGEVHPDTSPTTETRARSRGGAHAGGRLPFGWPASTSLVRAYIAISVLSRAPANGRPGSPFGFLGVGGREGISAFLAELRSAKKTN